MHNTHWAPHSRWISRAPGLIVVEETSRLNEDRKVRQIGTVDWNENSDSDASYLQSMPAGHFCVIHTYFYLLRTEISCDRTPKIDMSLFFPGRPHDWSKALLVSNAIRTRSHASLNVAEETANVQNQICTYPFSVLASPPTRKMLPNENTDSANAYSKLKRIAIDTKQNARLQSRLLCCLLKALISWQARLSNEFYDRE